MGTRDLLEDLAGAGLSVTAEGGRLVIRPASKLTDPMRAALRDAKPELIALLAGQAMTPAPPCNRPYRLASADADLCHAGGWDDAEITRFVPAWGCSCGAESTPPTPTTWPSV